jgi:AcrR family transcriptional regulator
MDTKHNRAEHLSSRVRFAQGARTARGARNAMAAKRGKSTQRARILDGMVAATAELGYERANVSAIIKRAGVSRPTFYEYFADRDDCLLAALGDIQDRLAALSAAALSDVQPRGALRTVLEVLIRFAQAQPGPGRFLTAEAMTCGEQALLLRDAGIDALAELVEGVQQQAAAGSPLPDVDPRIILGGAYRMVAMRLRRDEGDLAPLSAALGEWVGAYERPARSRRWAKLTPGREPAGSPHVPSDPIQQMPSVFPPGRTRASEQEVAENHRLRILYAVARLAAEKGYRATAIADIRKLARVDGVVFYRIFADKQEAFAAVQELGFQQVIDVTSKAFFSAAEWPERSWEAGRALTQLLDANPLIATVGFVEAYAAGAETTQRVEDSHAAFMFFMQDGLVRSKREPPPSREAMEAIIASIFEIVYLQARRPKPQTSRMLGYIAHLWLTPFLGATASDRFIDSRLERELRDGSRAGANAVKAARRTRRAS